MNLNDPAAVVHAIGIMCERMATDQCQLAALRDASYRVLGCYEVGNGVVHQMLSGKDCHAAMTALIKALNMNNKGKL